MRELISCAEGASERPARRLASQPVAAREEHHSAFGQDAFGRGAERAARFFGTPQYRVVEG
jgi:uncharacterized membrane protein